MKMKLCAIITSPLSNRILQVYPECSIFVFMHGFLFLTLRKVSFVKYVWNLSCILAICMFLQILVDDFLSCAYYGVIKSCHGLNFN